MKVTRWQLPTLTLTLTLIERESHQALLSLGLTDSFTTALTLPPHQTTLTCFSQRKAEDDICFSQCKTESERGGSPERATL